MKSRLIIILLMMILIVLPMEVFAQSYLIYDLPPDYSPFYNSYGYVYDYLSYWWMVYYVHPNQQIYKPGIYRAITYDSSFQIVQSYLIVVDGYPGGHTLSVLNEATNQWYNFSYSISWVYNYYSDGYMPYYFRIGYSKLCPYENATHINIYAPLSNFGCSTSGQYLFSFPKYMYNFIVVIQGNVELGDYASANLFRGVYRMTYEKPWVLDKPDRYRIYFGYLNYLNNNSYEYGELDIYVYDNNDNFINRYILKSMPNPSNPSEMLITVINTVDNTISNRTTTNIYKERIGSYKLALNNVPAKFNATVLVAQVSSSMISIYFEDVMYPYSKYYVVNITYGYKIIFNFKSGFIWNMYGDTLKAFFEPTIPPPTTTPTTTTTTTETETETETGTTTTPPEETTTTMLDTTTTTMPEETTTTSTPTATTTMPAWYIPPSFNMVNNIRNNQMLLFLMFIMFFIPLLKTYGFQRALVVSSTVCSLISLMVGLYNFFAFFIITMIIGLALWQSNV